MGSEKELVMEYEFRQFGEPLKGTDRIHWLYSIDRKNSPLGLVEYALGEWYVFEWQPDADSFARRVATLPGDMPLSEVLGVAKMLLLSLKESR